MSICASCLASHRGLGGLAIKKLNVYVFKSREYQVKLIFHRNIDFDLEGVQTSEHCYTDWPLPHHNIMMETL